MSSREIDDASGFRTTAQNENFVEDYFKASRLHFIGSFRARYESMMATVAERLGVHPESLLQPDRTRATQRSPDAQRTIVHVDLDCFFASVAARDNPSLRGKPIAVCHSGESQSTTGGKGGEISSCSYEARAYGVRAGMFFNKARGMCPDLIPVAYDFPAYEQVSIDIYTRFFRICGAVVQAQSIDEAYLDVTDADELRGNPSTEQIEDLVRTLRQDIKRETGCCASAGIGPSRLIARLATAKAKPDGQLYVHSNDSTTFMQTLPVVDLPGVGWRTTRRLHERGIRTCAELAVVPLADLQSEFGENQGRIFREYARGVDRRPVEPMKPRMSISVEASWGVRFAAGDSGKVRKFIRDMAKELATRCESTSATGKRVTYKAYRKKDEDPTPYKYLGHGPCDILTAVGKIPGSDSKLSDEIAASCLRLHASLRIPPDSFRGLGIQISDLSFRSLERAGAGKKGRVGRGIQSLFGLEESETARDAADSNALNARADNPVQHTGEECEPKARTRSDEPANAASANDVAKHAAQSATEKDRTTRNTGVANETAPSLVPPHALTDAGNPIAEQELGNGGRTNPAQVQSRIGKPPQQGRTSGLSSLSANGGPERTRPSAARRRIPAIQGPRPNRRSTEASRSRRGEQLTLSQLNALAQAQQHGLGVVAPEEFRTTGMAEALELLDDVSRQVQPRDGNHSWRRGGTTRNSRLRGRRPRAGSSAIVIPRERDIPSPPSLSSGSDNEDDSHSRRSGAQDGLAPGSDRIFEDSPLDMHAAHLQREWMRATAHCVKSAHVELLRVRFLELARDRSLAILTAEVLRTRLFAAGIGGGWVEGFNALLADVQVEVQAILGLRLAVSPLDDEP